MQTGKCELGLPVGDAWVLVASKTKYRWKGGVPDHVGHNASEVFLVTLCILIALLSLREIADAIVWHRTFYL
jgi:hypothetical protein